jgi:hypothetical protein
MAAGKVTPGAIFLTLRFDSEKILDRITGMPLEPDFA